MPTWCLPDAFQMPGDSKKMRPWILPMRPTCSSKPHSSIRSASSRTKKVTRSKDTSPCDDFCQLTTTMSNRWKFEHCKIRYFLYPNFCPDILWYLITCWYPSWIQLLNFVYFLYQRYHCPWRPAIFPVWLQVSVHLFDNPPPRWWESNPANLSIQNKYPPWN